MAEHVDIIKNVGFTIVWLPPPSEGGYHPKRWYNYDSYYGSRDQLSKLLAEFQKKSVLAVADLVINHRDGYRSWAKFVDPDFGIGYRSIHSNDSFFTEGPGKKVPQDQRGTFKDPNIYTFWKPVRNIDHTQPEVRQHVREYMQNLMVLGFKGFRFDVANGYPSEYMVEYLEHAKPEFAVAEYWNGCDRDVETYLNHRRNMLKAFDFPLMYKLISAIKHRHYDQLKTDIRLSGLLGLKPNGAVTFVDNHDTLHTMNPDEGFKQYHEMLAAYAFILTHPGVPCIYWEQLFVENQQGSFELNTDILDLILIRQNYKIKSDSSIYIFAAVSGNDGGYMAIIDNRISLCLGNQKWQAQHKQGERKVLIEKQQFCIFEEKRG